ncbi:transposase family protein, partial [Rossellomorea marisflavi]
MNSIIKLPGFEDVTITKMEEVEERLRIHFELPCTVHTCPRCSCPTVKVHDYRIQKIKHLKVFER